MTTFEYKYKCINTKCEKLDVIGDWIHTDDMTPSYEGYFKRTSEEIEKLSGKRFVPMPRRFHMNEYVCTSCKHEMEEVETREAEARNVHEVFIPKAEGDKGKDYYTRYKNSTGGKPEWNPVSKIAGTDSYE